MVGRDDLLGDALGALADDATAHGAPLTAAARWTRAAAVTTEPSVRADRLVAAARAVLEAGDVAWAEELLEEAAAVDATRVERLDARLVEVRRAVAAGRFDLARAVAEAADEARAAEDPVGVAELLVEVARSLLVDDPIGVGALIERAWELAGDAPGPVGLRATILHGCYRGVFEPGAEAEARVGRWRELLELEGPVRAGPFLADTVVLYLGYTGRRAEAHDLLDRIERALRASGASGALIGVLGARSFVSYGTDLRECVLAGREALALSEETGQPGLSSVALDTLAIAAANVGDAELTDQVCRRVLAAGSLRGEVWARAALGRLHLVDDRPELAVEQFALLRRRIGERNASFTQFESDEAEALVRVGRVDEARALLDDLAADAAARGGWSEAQHQRILALLAEDIDVAAEHFERARDAGRRCQPHRPGIVELTWGEALRRAKRRADARRHLEAAIERFELVGASGLRRRAEAELAAAGGAVDRDRPTDELLTPLELQVARLAVAGHTNRTIAAELFLSPRTVENHLGAVYRKLGVSGRPGLSARAADDAVLRATTAGGGA
ncbi:MAG: helix-turn-helix transcriptional regulator [Acidimicrobiales bacterium]